MTSDATSARTRRLWPTFLVIGMGIALATGCQSDDGKADRPIACGLLSAKTVETITGTTEVFSSGGLSSRDSRAGTGTTCEISDSGVSERYAQLRAFDSTLKDTRSLLATEKSKVRQCTSLTELARGGGYLCVRKDSTDAAIALPGRMIRISVTENGRPDQATPDNVMKWAEEIDEHIKAYDKRHAS